MKKRIFILLVFIILLIFTIVGLKEKTEYKGVNIDKVYIINKEDYTLIDENSTITISGDTVIDYMVTWKYQIKNIKNINNLPEIETLYPYMFTYNIYLNDNIINTNKDFEDSSCKNEYQKDDFMFNHKFYGSDAKCSCEAYQNFLISKPGNYKIEYFFTIKIDGVEKESTDSFSFNVLLDE